MRLLNMLARERKRQLKERAAAPSPATPATPSHATPRPAVDPLTTAGAEPAPASGTENTRNCPHGPAGSRDFIDGAPYTQIVLRNGRIVTIAPTKTLKSD